MRREMQAVKNGGEMLNQMRKELNRLMDKGKAEMQNVGLNINSYMSIGLFLTLLYGGINITTRLARIEADITAVRRDIVVMQERVNTRIADRWTASMMGAWRKQSAELNPTMKFPDVLAIQSEHPAGELK